MSSQAELEPADHELKASLDGFFKIVQKVSEDPSCRDISNTLGQITKLREENQELRERETGNLVQIGALMQKLNDEGKAVRELSEQKQLADTEAEKRISELSKQIQLADIEAEKVKKELAEREKDVKGRWNPRRSTPIRLAR